MSDAIGLIAGQGHYPIEAAASIRKNGSRVVAVAFHDLSDPQIEAAADEGHRIYLGQLATLFDILQKAGCQQLLLAGKVPKTFLYRDMSALRPDAKTFELIGKLGDLKDDSVLGAFAHALEAEGFSLLEQCATCPDLVAETGVLGGVPVDDEQRADIRFGWPIVKRLGESDVGQTVVVRKKAVMALEAIEGTDAAIRRGGELGGPGGCVIKAAKPSQDPRFDVPAVGLETLLSAAEVGIRTIAVEAGATLLIQRDAFLQEADRHDVAVVGVDEGGEFE